MNPNTNVTAIFAEDIRREISGQHSIIGAFDDIAEFPSYPIILPKISIFATIFTLIDTPFVPKSFRVTLSNGEILLSNDLPAELKTQQAELIANKIQSDEESPWIISLRLATTLTGIQIKEETKLTLEFQGLDGDTVKSNSLTFKLKRQPTTVISTK